MKISEKDESDADASMTLDDEKLKQIHAIQNSIILAMKFLCALLTAAFWKHCISVLLGAMRRNDDVDLSYGRTSIPFSSMEKRLHATKDIDVWFGKATLANGKDWCWYQVWESTSAPQPPPGQRRPDIVFSHGTGVHSGTFASHARRFLDAGFRLIVPDLPSHGYSSGVHVYQRHMTAYSQGLHAVIHDVARRDDIRDGIYDSQQKDRSGHQATFLLGLSFGGTVALHYAIDYPQSLRSSVEVQQGREIPIDGINVVGPVLGYSSQNISMPLSVAVFVYLLDKCGAGKLEILVPHKKCLDKDPKVFKALIDQDQRSHRGAFRAGHLLCINDGVQRLHQEASNILHPVYIQQGGQDRVACPRKTVSWIRRLGSKDKRMSIYPVCQHVIYRKANDSEEDLTGRVVCITDSVNWMLERWNHIRRNSTEDYTFTSAEEHALTVSGYSTPSTAVTPRLSPESSTESLSDSSCPAFGTSKDVDLAYANIGKTMLNRRHLSTSVRLANSDPSTYSSLDDDEMSMTCTLAGAGSDEKAPSLMYASDYVAIDPAAHTYKHPLLESMHKTTLPVLAEICKWRKYRPQWNASPELCPFDIDVFPEWTQDYREALEAAAKRSWLLSSFTRE